MYKRQLLQFFWIDIDRNRMLIGNENEHLIIILIIQTRFDRTDIISQCQFSCRLDAGKHSFHKKLLLHIKKRPYLFVGTRYVCVVPVSYTHLDVYKRQWKWRPVKFWRTAAIRHSI